LKELRNIHANFMNELQQIVSKLIKETALMNQEAQQMAVMLEKSEMELATFRSAAADFQEVRRMRKQIHLKKLSRVFIHLSYVFLLDSDDILEGK
jgi:DNA-binding transcriptional regulator YiaG